MSDSRVINFNAGPSALPESVLEEAAKGLLNFNNMGMGIAEISHRSKEFSSFLNDFKNLIRDQLDVPPTHEILFAQGGATAQFSATVLNLLARHRLLYPDLPDSERTLDYVITGAWSKAGLQEAQRLCPGGRNGTVRTVVDSRPYSADAKSFDNIPPRSAYDFSTAPALIYYCENETANGVQFAHDPAANEAFPFDLLPKDALLPLVADYSSSFLSRPIPRLADHAVIYAGAQKNVGPAGLTIIIVRKDCIVDVDAAALLGAVPVPLGMSYKSLADGGSMPNTPPVLAIYIAALVLKRNKQLGGAKYYEEVNRRKQEKVYKALREGEEKGVFKAFVKEGSGSWMNVVFGVLGDGKEAKFLRGAEDRGMAALKGHRNIGGIRVSLYNAITEEQTDKLVAYMREFVAQESAGIQEQ